MKKDRLVMVSVLDTEDKTPKYLKEMGFIKPLLLNLLEESKAIIGEGVIDSELVAGYLAYMRDHARCKIPKVYAFEPQLDTIILNSCLNQNNLFYFRGRTQNRMTFHLVDYESTIPNNIKKITNQLETSIIRGGLLTDLKELSSWFDKYYSNFKSNTN